ncbi:hypothetical protein BH10ACI3_BH10ACI3_29160 [soil metagenome]
MKYLLFIATAIFFIAGCQGAVTKNTDSGVPSVASDIKEISPTEAQAAVSKAYSQFIDVRTPEEYSGGHAARAINIPLDTLSTKLDTIEKNEPVYLICQTGNRSKKAAVMLKDAGYPNVLNVTGGTTAWEAAGLPMDTKPPHNVSPAK